MTKTGRRVVQVGVTLGAIVGLVGCTEMENGGDVHSSDVVSINGLTLNGLTLNGLTLNGLTLNGLTLNGLTLNGLTLNGLATTSGLSSTTGLMTTAGGRDVVKYMVWCAFPQYHQLVKQDQYGNSYTYPGQLGVAPEFESQTCGVDCQERVSACVLAHVNNSGDHIALWLDSESAIGWGQSTDYPYQEGSFFGNLFPSNWSGYYCLGKDWDAGAVPGRLGQPLASNVYVDPYGGNVGCVASNRCAQHSNGDGFDSCTTYDNYQWKHVVTVWRNFDVNTLYKICSYGSTNSCLGVTSASTYDGASVEVRSYTGAPGQTWWVLQVSPGKYKIVNANSGKALDQDTASPYHHVIQKTYSGATTQQHVVQSLGGTASQFGRYSLIPSSGSVGFDVPTTTDGTKLQLDSNLTADVAKWTIMPVGTLASSQGSGSGGTNPCASYCSNPTTMGAQNYQSGTMATSAVCYQTTYPISAGNCGNMSGRTFSINGDVVYCNGNFPSLPPKVNGGYCFQATAGGSSGAWFGTW